MRANQIIPVAAVSLLAASLGLCASAAILFSLRLAPNVLAGFGILIIVWRTCSCLAASSLAHMALDMAGHPGSARDLLARTALAELSWAVLLPLALIFRWLLAPESWVTAAAIIAAAACFNFYLRMAAISANRGAGVKAAMMSLLWPYLAAVGVSLIFLTTIAILAAACLPALPIIFP
ncbi:MAG: hypothetical protein ACYCPQ_05220 [Elusimicrobiota bacterium]